MKILFALLVAGIFSFDFSFAQIPLNSANFNSYAPTLTGDGATGSWNITAANSSQWNGYYFIPGNAISPDNLIVYDLGSHAFRSLPALNTRVFLGMPSEGESFQSVTDRGVSTSNLVQITGANRVPSTGAGLEMYASASLAVIQAYNRNTATGLPLKLNPSNADIHMVEYGGNVGVGTASPNYKLDVAGQAYAASGFASGGANPEGLHMAQQNSYISGWNAANNVRTGFLQFNAGSNITLNAENGHYLCFSTGPSERLRIDASGNIGIGTTNPTQKLSVDGTVLAKKVKVSQSPSIDWPDYVFDSSYQLASLGQVERFVQQNKHLPDVPSAAHVKKKGLDLGDNQVVLLKKIEELTLYIIEQDKQLERQKQVNETQKRHNATLENRLDAIERMIAGKAE